MRALRYPAALAALLLAAAAHVAARPLPPAAPPGHPYVEQFEDAYIDWGEGIAAAWGRSGPAEPGARERLEEKRRVAELDAKARLLRIIQGVRATTEIRVGDRSDFVERVRGIVRGAEIVEEREGLGGAYEVLVTVPLHGVEGLAFEIYRLSRPDAVSPAGGDRVAPAAGRPHPSGEEGPTSILIDARGTGLHPALLPRILDETGRAIASPETVDQASLRERGMAAYAVSSEGAAAPSADPESSRFARRRGPRSYRVKATAASGSLEADIVLSAEDADRLEASPETSRLLTECRVLILIESPVGGVEGIRGVPRRERPRPGGRIAIASAWPARD